MFLLVEELWSALDRLMLHITTNEVFQIFPCNSGPAFRNRNQIFLIKIWIELIISRVLKSDFITIFLIHSKLIETDRVLEARNYVKTYLIKLKMYILRLKM